VLNSNTFPISLGIAAAPSPVHYIFLFLVVLIIAIVLFVKFPSLRIYRKTRNMLFYFLVAVALVLTLFQAYEASKPYEASRLTVYNYYINDHNSNFPNYYPDRVNQFNLTCQYLETKPASFYMVVNSVNVSFPAQPQVNVSFQFNSTALKVLFTVSENTSSMDEDTRPILFSINENVTGFSFTIYPDFVSDTVFPAEQTFGMDYAWNEMENCYALSNYYQTHVQP
jgi:Ca2+/Na+ antiporter